MLFKQNVTGLYDFSLRTKKNQGDTATRRNPFSFSITILNLWSLNAERAEGPPVGSGTPMGSGLIFWLSVRTTLWSTGMADLVNTKLRAPVFPGMTSRRRKIPAHLRFHSLNPADVLLLPRQFAKQLTATDILTGFGMHPNVTDSNPSFATHWRISCRRFSFQITTASPVTHV